MKLFFSLVVCLAFSFSANAQIHNYGRVCRGFETYALWQPVESNPVSFIVIHRGTYLFNDQVMLVLGFNESKIPLFGCELYTIPTFHFFGNLNKGGFTEIKVTQSIPVGTKGFRMYFQAFYPKPALLSNGVRLTVY